MRLCVDYRKLNTVTKKDSFPLPGIDATLDTLAGNTVFSTLDLASGYWQVEVRPTDREKTAFALPSGLYEFETMTFGLANAPSTFQRLMNQVKDVVEELDRLSKFFAFVPMENACKMKPLCQRRGIPVPADEPGSPDLV
nr:unnamed protein product [Spirometra erinaceieuropaei]